MCLQPYPQRHHGTDKNCIVLGLRTVVREQLFAGHLFADNYSQDLFFAGNVVRGVSCSRDSYALTSQCLLVGVFVVQAYYRPVLKLRRSSGMHERGP